MAPGGEWVPLGGLERFRLEVCGLSQAEMLLFFVCFVLCLSNERVGSWMVVNM